MSTPAQVWSYRNLIANLAQRDLKARYKKSVLGWLWSLLNPAATLGIYAMVFGLFLGGNANAPGMGNGHSPVFALYLFCGLVIWNLFSGTINISISSFQTAGSLLTRTYFPPECPMVAGLATVLLQALLETVILMAIMILLGNAAWTVIYLVPIFVLLACFAFGMGLVLAVLNIRYRDVNYLMGILLQVWFYATPIVYPTKVIPEEYNRFLQFNPLAAYVNGIRRAIYHLDGPTAVNWGVMGGTAVVTLLAGWWLFSRLAPSVIEELSMGDDAIVVSNVSKEFRLQQDRAHSLKELVTRRDRNSGADRHQALSDVSLTIPKGAMYALVGHNGSGKSTLLRCIAGIYRPTSGSVQVEGRISTLLELGAGFHPDLTGRENVYMNATILGMGRKQIDAAFDDIVDFAGVREFIDSPVKIYSSGMFVRLGFSVAVHVDPEILIIDEVIAVGDTEFQRRCFDHLYALRKRGVTIVVVTHGIGTVESMCDGAAWLDHGVLQMTGTGAEVAVAYMDKVNAAERAERDAAEAASMPAGDTTETAVATAQVEDIRIDEVSFVDGDGLPIDFGVHREPLTIRVGYEAIRPVTNPVFGMALHSSAQVHVTGTNTKIDGATLGTLSGRGHVDFTVDALPLTPGDYDLTLAISDEYVQHNYDRREREFHLTVRHGHRQAPEGLMDLQGRWATGA